MTVKLYTLTGRKDPFLLGENATVCDFIHEWKKGSTPLDQAMFICASRPLEHYGLGSKLSILPLKEDHVAVYLVLRLSGASFTVGKMRKRYYEQRDLAILNRDYSKETLDCMINYFAFIDEVENLERQANSATPINDEDPITLDSSEKGVRWIENGKCFAMNYQSLVDYIKSLPNPEKEILNPTTRQPIPEPWHSNFLFMAALTRF